MTLQCDVIVFLVELGRFIYWVPVLDILKIFAQNLHIYRRNDSTSACIIGLHFIYILVLEDVIGSDVGGGAVFLAHTVYSISSVLSLIRNLTFPFQGGLKMKIEGIN